MSLHAFTLWLFTLEKKEVYVLTAESTCGLSGF